jgi:hypothetical protein
VLDEKNDIKIPQSENKFFNIKKSKVYKNSLEISFDPLKETDILNLFLILKSYVNNLIYIPNNFLITIENVGEKEFIAFNTNIVEFKNLKYFSFLT